MAKQPKLGLGKGLLALMGDAQAVPQGNAPQRRPSQLPIESLKPSPEQVKELAESIKDKGVLQPLLVRPKKGREGNYEIVAGERRWRAAMLANLHHLPVVIRDMNDSEALEIAIIENVQRENLSPIEEAGGYQRLVNDFGHTQEVIANLVGKSRPHIANLLRLLVLPDPIIEMVEAGELTMGHARTLVGVYNAVALAKEIISRGLSVRQAEKLVMAAKTSKASGTSSAKGVSLSKTTDTLALERDLTSHLGLKVDIHHKGDLGGEIRVVYKTLEQLDDVIERLRSK
jgi:ParB family transcriptional regulator, chromosome partitioning protein